MTLIQYSLKVTSKETFIHRYLYVWESSATLTILTEKELHCQVKTYSKMQINNGNLTLIIFYWGNPKNPQVHTIQLSFYRHAKNEAGCSNGLWDIDCQRGNLTRVTSKIATSHTGQL